MSSENTKRSATRSYKQKVRARRRAEVHRRITLAAVELHGTVGPARTTVSDIAERAGVRRATVYNHFPTDFDLIDSCSNHWFAENPPPDPAAWSSIADPVERARTALEAMYVYYDRGQAMLGKVLRDAPHVPALQEILRQKWWPLLEMMTDILAEGWKDSASVAAGRTADNNHRSKEIRASVRVALDYFTWWTLSESGLSDARAAKLALVWIQAGGKRTG